MNLEIKTYLVSVVISVLFFCSVLVYLATSNPGIELIHGTIIERDGETWISWTNTPTLWELQTTTNLINWVPALRKVDVDIGEMLEIRIPKRDDARFFRLIAK